ncbi:MAG: hypothetical protein FJW20_02470 [Acidimicrobiia bacterium]|nr:hypothetical protein [Acidimicrobiia bacterium]
MAGIGTITVSALAERLRAEDGLPAAVAELMDTSTLDVSVIGATQIIGQNVLSEIAEKALGTKYPLVYLYCERIVNSQKEKFVRFSGTAHMVVEVRVSQDRLEDMEERMHFYVDAVTMVLEQSVGEWADGICYPGGYEVTFGGVKRGGKNFLQTARVSLELDVRRN